MVSLMDRIKVLHIITRLDPGGSSTNTIETVARLDRNKYDAHLLFGHTQDPQGKILDSLKKKDICFTVVDELQREINPGKDIRAYFRLIAEIRKGQYDIVHTHTSKAGILGRWAAKRAKTKYIIHTPHGHVFYGYFNSWVTNVFILAERLTALFTHKIITLTEKGKDEHVHFKIAPADKFVAIYSGIDVRALEQSVCDVDLMKKSLSIPADALVFGVVARLDPVKGIEFLVEAMAEVVKRFAGSRLLIVGDGTRRKAIEEKIASLGLSGSVILTGHREDVAQLVRVMDIFVLPSLNEGMGRAILEAMAFARPVIATRTGGIPEVVIDGKTGLLVPAAQSVPLAEAMIRLASDRAYAGELGANGKNFLKDVFTLDKMVEKIEHLYAQVMTVKV